MHCYFHNDLDGHCSAAIVKRYWDTLNSDQGEYIEIDYKDDFPFDMIRQNKQTVIDEQIFIVDFSLQNPGDFEKLLEITPNVTWIDHHKTAIERHGVSTKKIPGIREIDKGAACELCWRYFFPDEEMPWTVKLLGDYDTWTFTYGAKTQCFQEGIKLENTYPSSRLWSLLLETKGGHDKGHVDFIEARGKVALKYRDNYYAKLIRSYSFPINFEGYRCIACNAGAVSSQLFDSAEKEYYDIMVPFAFDGNKWTVSLYTERPDLDVSEIAKRHGGGGHKQAAGFICKKLPFERMEGCE